MDLYHLRYAAGRVEITFGYQGLVKLKEKVSYNV